MHLGAAFVLQLCQHGLHAQVISVEEAAACNDAVELGRRFGARGGYLLGTSRQACTLGDDFVRRRVEQPLPVIQQRGHRAQQRRARGSTEDSMELQVK
eukprot:6736988-Prymnesium_polylepis.1